MQPIQMQLSPNQKIFSEFFLDFRNLHKIQKTAEEKMSFRLYLFPKLETTKSGVT